MTMMGAADTILDRIATGLRAAEVARVDFGPEGPKCENDLVAQCDNIFMSMWTHEVVVYWSCGQMTRNVRNMKMLRANFHLPPQGGRIVTVARLSSRILDKYMPQEM